MAEVRKMKSILVVNQSPRDIYCYIFPTKHKLLSSFSVILNKDRWWFYEKETVFEFELRVKARNPKERKMEIIFPMWKLEKDLSLRVSGGCNIQVKQEKLGKEKQSYRRQKNMADELSVGGMINPYEILNLSMHEVRKKSSEEQDELITRGCYSQLLRWHPDKNPENSDSVICLQVCNAYDTLIAQKTRVECDNFADFHEGWYSNARYKALFRPVCYIDKEKKQCRKTNWKRIGLLSLSGFVVVGGITLIILTAGMGASAGLGLITGGLLSGFQLMNQETCSVPKHLITILCGIFVGTLLGPGSAAITEVLSDTVPAALQWLASSAFRRFFTSFASNLRAHFVDGRKTTCKQFLWSITWDTFLAAICSIPAACVATAIQDCLPEEAMLANFDVSSFAGYVVKDTATSIIDGVADVAKERCDNNVENKAIKKHLKAILANIVNAFIVNTSPAVSGVIDNFCEDTKETGISEESGKQNEGTDDIKEESNRLDDDVENQLAKKGLAYMAMVADIVKDNNEGRKETGYTTQYFPSFESLKAKIKKYPNMGRMERRLKYISKGYWFSKMIVTYKENGKKERCVVKGSKSSISIPNKATDIKVRFQVKRFIGIWCDVKKYDRFSKCWVQPNQPHVFQYKTPVNRTYTLAGNLYYEAVMKITEDFLDVEEI